MGNLLRKPISIILIMLWQILVIAYSTFILLAFSNVVSIGTGATILGIGNPGDLRTFFLIVLIVNITTLVGIYKKQEWGRLVLIVSLAIILLLKFVQFMSNLGCGFSFFFKGPIIPPEFLVMLINICIIIFLLVSKNVKNYFIRV